MNAGQKRRKPTMTHKSTVRALLPAGAIVLAALAAGGCRGEHEDKPPHQFFPDLDDQPKWKPQTASDFYVDGRTMRQPVAGTVPFGLTSTVSGEAWAANNNKLRDDVLHADPAYTNGTAGADAQGNPIYVKMIPASVKVDAAMLKRGQERFDIYCAVCHGYVGDGKGLVAQFYQPMVVNLHDETFFDPKNVRSLDGWIYHTIRWGKPGGQPGKMNMPAYGHALNEQDAWAVTAYVRALQESGRGTINDVPEAQRGTLNRSRPPATPGGTPAAPTTNPAPATPAPSNPAQPGGAK